MEFKNNTQRRFTQNLKRRCSQNAEVSSALYYTLSEENVTGKDFLCLVNKYSRKLNVAKTQ